MHFARAVIALVSTASFCLGAAGCSNSSSGGGTTPSGPLPASVVTGLQQAAAMAQTYASVPTDPQTLKVAAQVSDLLYDREVQLATAAHLLASESVPKVNVPLIEVVRQAAIAKAAADLSKIQSLQQSGVPGQGQIAADGGADEVITALIAKTFAARAQTLLTQSSNGTLAFTADQLSAFLQEIAVVMGDDEPGGHNVAGRALIQELLSDAGLTMTDTGAP